MKLNTILANKAQLPIAMLLLPMASLVSITILTDTILASSYVSADNDSVVDQVNITVPVSCTMTGTGMNSHNAEIANGTYTPNIGSTTLHAFCNDNEGFAIYAAGYTGNEIGGTNSNKLVGTTASGNSVIESGIATSAGNPDISNWAMKLTMTQDSGDTTTDNAFTIDSAPNVDLPSEAESGATEVPFSQYHVVPNEYVKVAHKNSMTDMTATTGGVKLTTTYAAYISKTQPADTYSGQVKYTLVHPSTADAPIEPVTIEDAYSKAGKTKLNGYYKIQDMDSTICSKVSQYSGDGMAEVIDVRDNNIYRIAKLADDNCWMLDNLALDPTNSATAANMNASNTNATQEAITNLLNGGSTTTGWGNTAVANVTTNFSNNDSYVQPRINNASKDTLVTSYDPASTNGQAKVGIYYNFCAASASTYCYESGSGIDVSDTLIDAPEDICPANWRMPTGGNTGEYFKLAQKYGSDASNTNSLQYNLSTPLSGSYYGSSTHGQGSYGYWWSSTYVNSNYMYNLGVDPANVYPNNRNRSYGQPMRCLMADQSSLRVALLFCCPAFPIATLWNNEPRSYEPSDPEQVARKTAAHPQVGMITAGHVLYQTIHKSARQ